MNISNQKPPNWDNLVAIFGADWRNTVVTYGDTVHSARALTPDLRVHEAVHIVQQKSIGVSAWWDRYYVDPDFRLDQELEAYQAQYDFMRRSIKDRNLLFKFRDHIAREFSSKLYGNCITYQKAFDLIAKKIEKVIS